MTFPFQPPLKPMLAALSRTFPTGGDWLYEPKWDGFRGIVYWDGQELYIQSRDERPLGRYFPELESGLKASLPPGTVVDGEVVVAGPDGLDFESLQLRIHPAASRINLLAKEIPASFVAFDLLAEDGRSLLETPQAERRARLERHLARAVERQVEGRHPLRITPATTDEALARSWFDRFEGAGLDGVIARPMGSPYRPDQRVLMKIKHQRTADCVVGGFRWLKGEEGKAVGSLLLGLYDERGVLHHVGHSSSFKRPEKRALVDRLQPYRTTEDVGFGQGRPPGAPSRWRSREDTAWESVRPELVCEVAYDHTQGDRFRHGATFIRWRPDKPPAECTYSQLEVVVPYELKAIFDGS